MYIKLFIFLPLCCIFYDSCLWFKPTYLVGSGQVGRSGLLEVLTVFFLLLLFTLNNYNKRPFYKGTDIFEWRGSTQNYFCLNLNFCLKINYHIITSIFRLCLFSSEAKCSSLQLLGVSELYSFPFTSNSVKAMNLWHCGLYLILN